MSRNAEIWNVEISYRYKKPSLYTVPMVTERLEFTVYMQLSKQETKNILTKYSEGQKSCLV